jgi:hypothetical protein
LHSWCRRQGWFCRLPLHAGRVASRSGTLEVPAWMFDRMACPDPGLLTAQPYVSIEALAALSALLDLALKDQTPSAVLLSGASGASHDQNRGEIHVTRDEKLRERIPTQSTIAPAASDRSVRERASERRHRRACMAGATGGSAGSAHKPDDAVDPRPCCDDSDAARRRLIVISEKVRPHHFTCAIAHHRYSWRCS